MFGDVESRGNGKCDQCGEVGVLYELRKGNLSKLLCFDCRFPKPTAEQGLMGMFNLFMSSDKSPKQKVADPKDDEIFEDVDE